MIIAIDPGMTTGYAVIDEFGNLIETGNLCPEDIDCSVLTMEKYHDPTHPITVVVEYTPIPTYSRMNRQLQEVVEKVDKLFPNAIKITPGVWKSSLLAKNFPWPGEGDASPHQKDAYRMGIYHLMFRSFK